MKALFYYILCFLLLKSFLLAADGSVVKDNSGKENVKSALEKELIESANKVIKDFPIEKKDVPIETGKIDSLTGSVISETPETGSTNPAEKEEKTIAETYSDIFANTVEEQYTFQKETALNANPCPELELSLEVVFNCIEAENLTVLLNREKIEEALQNAFFARADLLPQLSLSLQQNRTKTVNDFGSGDVTFTNSLFNATIQGSFVVFDLTKIAGYQEAKIGIAISKLNYNAILQQVLFAAGTAYFNHVKNLRGLNVIDANLAEARILLDLAKTRFNVGVASPIDVTRAEVQVAIYERNRLGQQFLIKESEVTLKSMLDIDVDQLIIIPNIKVDQTLSAPSLSIPSLNSVLVNRYDYLKNAETLALNEYQSMAAAWAYYPSISLTPGLNSWGYATPYPFKGNWVPEWSITIALTMPIFDGFRIRSDILRKNSIVRQQKDVLLDLANIINAELSLNSFDVETRYKQIVLVRRQVDLGEKELQLAKTRFKEGVADNLEVVTAQTSLALASDDLVQIMFAYDTARLDWARTLGDIRLILGDGYSRQSDALNEEMGKRRSSKKLQDTEEKLAKLSPKASASLMTPCVN